MNKIEQIKLSSASTIREALQAIDRGAIKIALVVDDHERLLGTITDGDIRRAFLKGLGIEDSIENIYFREPTYCTIDDSREVVLQKALDKKIQQIPILDHHGRVIRIEGMDDLIRPRQRTNKVVIMAGGLGSRLRPLTHNTPKPMLPVGKKPILELILENCRKSGFTEFIFCVNYLSPVIKDYFRNGESWGVSIQYVEEEKRMGTAGALSLAAEELQDSFLVMNGDLLTDLDFSSLLDFHLAEAATATVCVREYEHRIPFGVLHIQDDAIHRIEEKPAQKQFISAGIYAFSPEALEFIPKNTFLDMPSLLQTLLNKEKKIASFLLHENWLDIGRMHDLEKANSDYADFFGEDES
ncbi:MAG: nucleotidyltransferase family protein [Desulfobacteraceae bacterium]|nr:nucleotidyltransferase family protein [Desulfobacteraceae bacterium]